MKSTEARPAKKQKRREKNRLVKGQAHTQNEESQDAPKDIAMHMSQTPDNRRGSGVRWSVQNDIFVTGRYPYLSWDLYECHPDQNKQDPPTPDVFFKTIKELGHGSFGVVKLVELKLTGERLAMKVMLKDKCPHILRIKELHAFLQIGWSPFVVRFHSCFKTDAACYLLMQYHCGGNLAKVIEEFGVLCEETARFFVAEVSEGLFHLHSRGIIHRDIKLANILLGVDNHVRICDLGLCKLGMTGQAKTHTRCGALRYCAPEVLAREWYGKEVDWWSLGVVLFRMVTGQYPFDAASREVIEELIKCDEPNLELVPDGHTKDIINSFLQKNPQERLGAGNDAENLIRHHPFFEGMHWEQLQARKIKAPSVQKRFMRRGSVIRMLAFGAVDPNASRSRQILSRIFQILFLRVFTICATVGLVFTLSNSERRTYAKAYFTQMFRVGANMTE